MVEGKDLWESEITGDMEWMRISETKQIETFPGLPENLYRALEQTARRYPDKTALVGDGGRKYTYRQFLERSREFAIYLRDFRGVGKGSHVGLMLYNSPEFCIAFLALIGLGAVTVPLPGKFKQAEVLPLAERADVEQIICDQDYAGWFADDYKKEQILIISESGGNDGFETILKEWKSRGADGKGCGEFPGGLSADSLREPALILFTSGTTSRSKGVLIKNYNIMHAVEAYRRTLHITGEDISVIATPIYHITGLVALLGLFLFVGGTLYLHRFFDAERVLREARKYGFTFIHASPTVFHLLLEKGEHTPEIPSLVSFACGSGNMVKDKMARLHDWLPKARFHTVYGLTETTSPAAVFPGDAAVSRYIGSSGLPIPGTRFKIVDENRRELPDGEVGEIAVSGSVVLDGYYRQEADSLEEGWLYTGDLGYFSEKHFLYVVDRKKDMINRGGEKIWCYDVENEITSMEGILDAAVVGIPDELYGEVAAAAVQTAEGCTLTETDIRQYLGGRMAKYKIPVKIRMVDSIPQTPNGKTDKIRIQALLREME